MRSIRLPRNLLLAGLACAAASAALAQVPEPPHGAAPCSPSGHALHPVDLHPGPPGEGRGGPPEAGPLEGPLPPFLHGLDLSEEQQDRVFAIVHELVPKLRQQARAARKAHEQLHQMSLGETYDEARARGLADGGARAEAELSLLRLHADREILGVLSPEQRQQASAQRAALDCAGPEGPGRRQPRPLY